MPIEMDSHHHLSLISNLYKRRRVIEEHIEGQKKLLPLAQPQKAHHNTEQPLYNVNEDVT